ncbi:MAG: EamA family transporter, partial [Nodosilinea sp.]
LTPVFALLFGNLFLAERLTALQWLGVGLTLVSIYLINQRQTLTRSWQRRLQSGLAPRPAPLPEDNSAAQEP